MTSAGDPLAMLTKPGYTNTNNNNSSTGSNYARGGGDYGNGGLRSSARTLSSNSFSTSSQHTSPSRHYSNMPPRDPSAHSIKNVFTASNAALSDLHHHHHHHQQQTQTHYQSSQSASNAQASGASSSKLTFIKDLQVRLMDMQKECYLLRCELDTSQQKLAASMQSIKQFWSPELKVRKKHSKHEKYSSVGKNWGLG